MKLRTRIAALSLAVITPLTLVACGDDSTSATTSSTTSSTSTRAVAETRSSGASSVSSEADLVALVQEAYGDGGLGLHRGHQPVEDVLDEVLTISHDELHVRMEEQGQNLAAVAEDLGIDPQTLIDALVESWRPAIDELLEAGTITQDEADGYVDALEEAFTFRVTWDGEEATPTFTGL